MSNLLKSVTSKLAQSGLTTSNTTGNSSDEDPNEWQTVGIESPAESEAEQDEEELVAVRSQPATIPSTPASSSRPSSPPPATTGGARKKSGLDATWTSVSSAKVKNKKDPLRAFGSEISQKIFLQLPISALLRCSLVCKKWRKSATINYSYFKSIQSSVFDPSIQSPSLSSTSTSNTNPPSSSSGGAKWTRRESKTDWRLQYLKNLRIERRDSERSESNSMLSSGYSTPSRSQKLKEMGLITPSEKREQEWKIQKEEQEKGYSKDEMRDYYKGLGNKGGKVKGKRGKGGVKTGSVDDGGIWE